MFLSATIHLPSDAYLIEGEIDWKMQYTQRSLTLISLLTGTFLLRESVKPQSDVLFSLNTGDYVYKEAFSLFTKGYQNSQELKAKAFIKCNWLQWSIYRFISDYKSFAQITKAWK